MKDAKRILELLNSDDNLSVNMTRGDYRGEDIKDYIAKKINQTFVYEEDGKVVGVVVSQFWTTYFHLNLIVIDKNYRGKGIGAQLVKHVETLAKKRGIGYVELVTEEKNSQMQRLMDKLNYRKGNKFLSYCKDLK